MTPSKFFRKFIRFGGAGHPLGWLDNLPRGVVSLQYNRGFDLFHLYWIFINADIIWLVLGNSWNFHDGNMFRDDSIPVTFGQRGSKKWSTLMTELWWD